MPVSAILENQKKSPFTRFVIWYRNEIRPVLDAYKYLILIFGWIAVFFTGYLGFSELHPGESIPSLLTLTLQIFMAPGGNLQISSSLPLNFARIAAMVLLYISIIAVVVHWFYYQFELLWLKLFTRNHIVICGLGQVGSIVVRNVLSNRAVPIVVIERDPANPEIDWCKSHGITVITGNTTERTTLEQARISTAEAVYVATGSDEINATVIAWIYENLPGRKDTLHCYAHIIDPNFTNLLRASQMSVAGTSPVSLDFFNMYQIANFCVLDCIPDLFVPSQNPPQQHILIVGLGKMGEGLILELAKRWMHTYGPNPEKRITITAIDRDASRKTSVLETRYPRLCTYCEILPCSIDIFSPEFYAGDFLDTSGKPLNAVFVCLSDESLNFSTGLYLNLKLQEATIPIIIRTVHSSGISHFFERINQTNSEEYKNIRPFPLVSCRCCIESLIGMNEMIARSIHRTYITMRAREGDSPELDPAMKPWGSLDTQYREASRAQAANIKQALQKNGFSIVSRTDWDEPLVEFSESEVERMAKIEHDRWWGERVHRGWEQGSRSLEKKTTPYLIPYDQLDERMKDYDRDFVRLYPKILEMVDLSIRRTRTEPDTGLPSSGISWACSPHRDP